MAQIILHIQFPTREALVEWYQAALADGHMDRDSAVVKADALDLGGRATPGDYMIRRKGTRPPAQVLAEGPGPAPQWLVDEFSHDTIPAESQ
jgi:hypothetical protein